MINMGNGLFKIEDEKELKALLGVGGFEIEAMILVDPDMAKFIRKLRIDDGYTWRAVARDVSNKVNSENGSNQLWGMALCKAAAKHFDEDYMEEPWN